MIEKVFDVSFIANLAINEKQIQQNYRPIIAVHKWFARRPGTLFRGLLLSEFVKDKLSESYYRSHNLKGIQICDPFMGGGTPLFEANRLGCNVIGCDINPMSYWIVRQKIDSLNLDAYHDAASQLLGVLEQKIGSYYKTTCTVCNSGEAPVKYFIWVKSVDCIECNKSIDLFPGYVLSENRRHPKYVLICHICGELAETPDRKKPGICHACGEALRTEGPASRNRCTCPFCHKQNSYPDGKTPPTHRMIAIEYYCPHCKSGHQGRFFKKPDSEDLIRYEMASQELDAIKTLYVPEDIIPQGDETNRLHRWGYRRYREMFNSRQLLGLELSCRAISSVTDNTIKNALATNLSDLLRYQNMLCRYDSRALKSLDIFSVHGFPVGLIQCESNLLGIKNGTSGVNIGSGGWANIIEKYKRAKSFCEKPFEIIHRGASKVQIPIAGEWIGTTRNEFKHRSVELHCGSSTQLNLPPDSLDGVFTDPPYFANVQYAELMDFCYVWLRRLINNEPAFSKESTRDVNELTGNVTMQRDLDHFTTGLSSVFIKMAQALKPGAPLAFTYHHNSINAYFPVSVAILDAGLTCSATIPCPAEMGASIHINNTGSSVMDTIFVCRSTGYVSRYTLASSPEEIACLVRHDLKLLQKGNIKPAQGDIRCIAYGHLIRLAIWNLRNTWKTSLTVQKKLELVAQTVEKLGGWEKVKINLGYQGESVYSEYIGPDDRKHQTVQF